MHNLVQKGHKLLPGQAQDSCVNYVPNVAGYDQYLYFHSKMAGIVLLGTKQIYQNSPKYNLYVIKTMPSITLPKNCMNQMQIQGGDSI